MATSTERVKDHRVKMQNHGFKRINAFISAELAALLESQSKHRCVGRTLETLILGKSAPRP